MAQFISEVAEIYHVGETAVKKKENLIDVINQALGNGMASIRSGSNNEREVD
jgi:hypothetical protein